MLRRLSFSMSAWALSLVFGVGFCLAPSARAEAALKVAEIFSDNMVLQRDIQAPVWGEGTAGRRVTVRLGGQVVMATVDAQGRWLARLAPMAAGGPHVMSVADGAATLTLRNVLVGEVWLAGGQSNMEVGLAGVEGGEAAIAAADDPQLRFIPVPRTTGPLIPPKNDWSFDWKATTPQTAPMFSAVGYFYARELRKALGVPVGIIDCNYGATPVETWMSPEAMRSDPDFQPILDRYAAACKAHTPAEFDDLAREYARQWTQLKIDYGKWVKGGSVGPRPSPPRLTPGPFDYSSPSVLYGTMIKKVAPYGLRGFIWYQGESNAERAWQYRKLFPALIADWRREWQLGDVPFLFVQLAPYEHPSPKLKDTWPELREAQLRAWQTVPNTGMAVTADVGDPANIHPTRKEAVGRRLALLALRQAYGRDVVCSGPIYKSMKVSGDRIILEFDHVGGGLVAKDGALAGFTICGADRQFVPAQARIAGNTVEVWNDAVKQPAAVRYGWANYVFTNLANAEGLPASPFRTDDFPALTKDVR